MSVMFLAVLLTAVLWNGWQAPVMWLCNPGKTPYVTAPSNCERVGYRRVQTIALPPTVSTMRIFLK